jgi:AcrR family transcriptional regulator
MVRWQPNARGRLEAAALELYRERGFDQTTVAEIAERAGLTERTFYRHFADKREVLFGGQNAMADCLVTAVRDAPESAAPIDAVGAALLALVPIFTDRHAGARQRQAVVAATPGLQERELMKLATLATALTDALRARGIPDITAQVTAEIGIAIFKLAFQRWIDSDDADLADIIRELLAELGNVGWGDR